MVYPVRAQWKHAGCNNPHFGKLGIILDRNLTEQQRLQSNWTEEEKNVWSLRTLAWRNSRTPIWYITNRRQITVTQTSTRELQELREERAIFRQMESMGASFCAVGVVIIFNRARLLEIVIVYFYGAVR